MHIHSFGPPASPFAGRVYFSCKGAQMLKMINLLFFISLLIFFYIFIYFVELFFSAKKQQSRRGDVAKKEDLCGGQTACMLRWSMLKAWLWLCLPLETPVLKSVKRNKRAQQTSVSGACCGTPTSPPFSLNDTSSSSSTPALFSLTSKCWRFRLNCKSTSKMLNAARFFFLFPHSF